jgi:hypothetical protein
MVTIQANSTYKIKLIFSPTADAIPTSYVYALSATRSSDSAFIEKQLVFRVQQTVPALVREYTPSCTVCSRNVSVSARIQNVGGTALRATAIFNLNGIEKKTEISDVPVLTERVVTDNFDVSGYSPGQYALSFMLVSGNATLYSKTDTITVPVFENVIYEKSAPVTPFGMFVTLKAANHGNINSEAKLHTIVSKSPFVYYSGPQPQSVENGEYVWSSMLTPGQELSIGYAEIWWPVPLIIVLIIIGGILVYRQFTTLEVRKHVLGRRVILPDRDMTVSLEIRNRGAPIDDIIVRDVVPPLFAVTGRFDTMRPVMRKIAEGTELVWRVGRLGRNDSRLINYKIIPGSSVLDRNVTLPHASVRGKFGNQTVIRHSNPAVLEGTPSGARGTATIKVDISKDEQPSTRKRMR